METPFGIPTSSVLFLLSVLALCSFSLQAFLDLLLLSKQLQSVDDHVVLYGTDSEVPYVFGETEDGFTMTFLNDGDVATMQFVDMDDFVSDLVAGRMAF